MRNLAALILSMLLASCTLEMVMSKPVGGCSDVTMRSIDTALVNLNAQCAKEKEVKP